MLQDHTSIHFLKTSHTHDVDDDDDENVGDSVSKYLRKVRDENLKTTLPHSLITFSLVSHSFKPPPSSSSKVKSETEELNGGAAMYVKAACVAYVWVFTLYAYKICIISMAAGIVIQTHIHILYVKFPSTSSSSSSEPRLPPSPLLLMSV